MNKKIIGFLLFSLIGFGFSFSFAQETIKTVSLKFCDGGTGSLTDRYSKMINPGEQKEFCIYIENNGKEDAQVNYSFPKAFFSPGGNNVCDTSNDFARFFVGNPNRSLVVPGGKSMIIKENIMAPIGMSGMYYGCLAYQLSKAEVSNMGGMFNLVVRKALLIDLFVGGDSFVKNSLQFLDTTGTVFSTNKHVGMSSNAEGDWIVNLNLENNGNTTQNIVGTGKIYNALGFEKSFTIETQKLAPGQVLPISKVIGILPFYKGLYSVKLTLQGEPTFDFDASSLSEKNKAPVIIKETSSLFIFSWVYVITILVLLAIIVKLVLPRKKIKVEEVA